MDWKKVLRKTPPSSPTAISKTNRSFVLGNSSMDAIQPGTSSPSVENGQNMTVMNSPEMERKLEELTQENVRLMASLEMNNTAMNEHRSALANRQEELAKVFEAHRQKFAETKNRVEILEAENDELKARIEAVERDNADQSTQTEKTEDDPKPASSVAAVDNNLSTELTAMAEKCEHQNQEIAHAHKIIASLKDQLESLYRNTFNPIKPEDLQSTVRIQEGPHRQQFVESFAYYNEKLRELGYCYAAQTSRYTSIQDCLHRCSEILLKTENPTPSGESRKSLRSEISEDLQECRSALVGEELKTIAEREEMIRAQNEYQKIFIDYSSIIFEIESLRREIERLNGALQSAVALRDERHNKAEAAVKEKERLVEEQRRGVEKDRQDLLAQRTELQRSIEANASGLRKNESLLEEKRKALEKDRKVLEKDREVLEKDRKVLEKEREVLKKDRGLLEKEREVLKKDRGLLEKDREVLKKDRGLLEKNRNDFSAEKTRAAQSNEASDRRLREQEASLNEIEAHLKAEKLKFGQQVNEFILWKESYDNPYRDYRYRDDSDDSYERCRRCGRYHD